MTFYKFFNNKIKLAKTIYKNIIEDSIQSFDSIANSTMTIEEKIERLFLLKVKNTENISYEFISDIYNNKELGLVQYTDYYLQIVTNKIKDFFIREQ